MTSGAGARLAAPTNPRWPWAAALAALMAAGGLLSPVVGVLAPMIVTDLGIAPGRLGIVIAVYFSTAALVSTTVGRVVDDVGAMRAAGGILLAVPVIMGGVALAPSLPLLALAAAPAGVILAVVNPATNLAVAERFPAGLRGTVLGWKQAGIPAAGALAGAVAPALALAAGWRVALVATAAFLVGLTWVLLRFATRRSVARPRPRRVGRERARPEDANGGPVITLPGAWGWLSAYAACMGAAVGASNTYLVLFAADAVGFGAVAAGLLAVVTGGCGALTRVVWSTLGERSIAPPRLLVWLSVLATLAVVLTAAAVALGGGALWLAAILQGVSVQAWSGLAMLLVLLRTPDGAVARASAGVMRGFYLGLLGGPLAFGVLLDGFDYVVAWALIAVLTAVAAGLAWRYRHPSADAAARRWT